MPAILDYKCPNCGGNIKFDPSNQQFKCENCDSVFTSEQLKSYSDMINAAEQKSNYEFVPVSDGAVMDNMNGYICKSCGAQLITDETSSASSCPYCGNPTMPAIWLRDSSTGKYSRIPLSPAEKKSQQILFLRDGYTFEF